MADDRRGGRGYPQRDDAQATPHYPPPPGDEDERRRLPPVSTGSVTLPSISSAYPPPPAGYPYPPPHTDPRYAERGYPPDPRYPPPPDHRPWPAEPPSAGAYPPPPPPPTAPDSRYPAPPAQSPHPHDARSYDDRRAYEDRRSTYDDRRPPYDDRRAPYDDRRGPYDDRRPPPYDPYYPHPPPPRGAYPMPHDAAHYYHRYPGPAFVYAAIPHPPQPPPPQAAPRQRTSIACRYCRKRKIRCSGYQNTQNGKCTNCDKLRIDCVFQPVSSNSSAAFVPVQALPGGVPPGTPLYGAWGQPIGATGPHPMPAYPHPTDYPPPLHSPTSGGYPPAPYDDRGDSASVAGRRRRRPTDDEPSLQAPPNYPADDDPRRRSPASTESSNTPPTMYHAYGPGPYDQDRTPTPQRPSPSGSAAPASHQAPARTHSPPQPHPSGSTQNPMSLGHLISTDELERSSNNVIDRAMLGRLNRRS